MAREDARQETVLASGEHRWGVGWVGSSAPTDFRVSDLCKSDIHRPKGLFLKIVKSVIKRNCSRLSLTYAFTR